jgi:hypothetical protein
MYVKRYNELDGHLQNAVLNLKSSKIINALSTAQAKVHLVGINILKGVRSFKAGIKSGYNTFIKPEIINIKVSAEKMIMKSGTKKIKNSVKMVASVLFLSWVATLPVSFIYNTTIRWISKAAIAVQPYWTWFHVATTTLAIANAVFSSINTVINIRKIRRAERLLKVSTVGDTPMMESILNGVKKNSIQNMFTSNTEGLNKRLSEIQNSDDENLKKETESILAGRVRTVEKIQKLLLVSNVISVVGSILIVSGVPLVGIPVALLAAAVTTGVRFYSQVKTYRFEKQLGMVVVAPNKDTNMIRKRDRIKSFARWQFSGASPTLQPAKVKAD